MTKRREFREQYQDVKDHKKMNLQIRKEHTVNLIDGSGGQSPSSQFSPSMNMVEELMLASHTVLPLYFDHVISKTKGYLKDIEIQY